MKTTSKKTAYRFMLTPRDREAMAFLVARRERAVGFSLHATAVARAVLAQLALDLPDVAVQPLLRPRNSTPWSMTVDGTDLGHLDAIKEHYDLKFRNEAMGFALRVQAGREGWKTA